MDVDLLTDKKIEAIRAAAEADSPLPQTVTRRACAYLLGYYDSFKEAPFSVRQMVEGDFPKEIANDFRLDTRPFADPAMLGRVLPGLKLLEPSADWMSFRLSPRGLSLARLMTNQEM